MIVDHRGNPIRRSTPRRLADTEPVVRNSDLSRAVRGFARDRPIGYTIAPNPARQIWELHRIREESRQQSLASPHFSGFLEWVKNQVLGTKPFGLRFPSMPREERDRLRDPALHIRNAWRAYQEEMIGARDETLGELVGQCIDWMLVDGDCFVMPYRDGGTRRYQGYPGDALAETSHTPGTVGRTNEPQRALGIEVDVRGPKPRLLLRPACSVPELGLHVMVHARRPAPRAREPMSGTSAIGVASAGACAGGRRLRPRSSTSRD